MNLKFPTTLLSSYLTLLVLSHAPAVAASNTTTEVSNTTTGVSNSTTGALNTTTGASNTTTGVSNTATGASNTTTGASNTTIGASNTTTGASNTTIGASNTTTGASNTTIGASNTTTGASNTTTGASNTTTGASNTTTGASNPTTGASNSTTGVSNTTTGALNTTIGASNTTTGASNTTTGASNTTTGASNTTTGASNTTIGTSNTTTGASNTTTGVSNTTTGASNTTTGASNTTIGASDTTTGAANKTTGASDTTTGASDTITGASDTITGASDTITGASDTTTGASNTITGASDTTTGASDTTTGASNPITPKSISSTTLETSMSPTAFILTDGSINVENPALNIPVIISFNKNFTEELNDHKSPEYKQAEQEYGEKLSSSFANMTNFLGIKILGFKRGSVITLFEVLLKVDVNKNINFDTANLEMELLLAKKHLMTLPDVNTTFLNTSFDNAIQAGIANAEMVNKGNKCAIKNYCTPGYDCDAVTYSCQMKCIKKYCPQHAKCVIDEVDFTAQCRCISDDKMVYGGDKCSISAERLELSSSEIIATSVSVGCAVIIIVIVITIWITYKRMSSNKPDESLLNRAQENGTRNDDGKDILYPPRRNSTGEYQYLNESSLYNGQDGHRSSIGSRNLNVDLGFYSGLMKSKSELYLGSGYARPYQWQTDHPVTRNSAQSFSLTERHQPTRNSSRSDRPNGGQINDRPYTNWREHRL